jgi:hypothetical protein
VSPVEPLVYIEVTVNVNDMRRGQRRTEALTPRIEALELAGYIKILGHAEPPAPEPQPEPAPAPPRLKRSLLQPSSGVTSDGSGSGAA